jgi:hypothetical protein
MCYIYDKGTKKVLKRTMSNVKYRMLIARYCMPVGRSVFEVVYEIRITHPDPVVIKLRA